MQQVRRRLRKDGRLNFFARGMLAFVPGLQGTMREQYKGL